MNLMPIAIEETISPKAKHHFQNQSVPDSFQVQCDQKNESQSPANYWTQEAVQPKNELLSNDSGTGETETKTRKKRSKKRMSYDELIRNRRESNRLAALRCRQKKMDLLCELNKRSDALTKENQQLEDELTQMKEKLMSAQLKLVEHKMTGCLLKQSPIDYHSEDDHQRDTSCD